MHLLFFTILSLLCCSCSKEAPTFSDNALRIATAEDPVSLDPRLVRDLPTATAMRMLYEGLTRIDSRGMVVPATAESFVVSQDQKTYTFNLRESRWSDGTLLTAQDFEETWKSMLSPSFPAPNAYQLYVIKGAREAKEGKIPLQHVGVKAADSRTLVVELERPSPYFLELVSCHFFFPVSPAMRQAESGVQTRVVICNGPFILNRWEQRSEFAVVKNPYYWDKEHVKLDKICLLTIDERNALQLFSAGMLDWAGSPLSTLPQDAVPILKEIGTLQCIPAAGTHWFRLNTRAVPFNNEKMRRAFALALDRRAIVDHVTQGGQQPAIGILPPLFRVKEQTYFADHDVETAKNLFKESIKEMELSKEELRPIVLSYSATDRNHKVAQTVQQQWHKTFGIPIYLESSDALMLFDRMRTGSYQISIGSWFADICDPINFLEIFKSKDNPTNQTFWQNEDYVALLDRSSSEMDAEKRLTILLDAEKTLIANMPIIPLFHSCFNYLKKDRVAGVYFSPLGYLDFKEAYLVER